MAKLNPTPGKQVGTGFLRGKLATGDDARAPNHANNPQVARSTRQNGAGETKIAHDRSSGLSKPIRSAVITGGRPQGTGIRSVESVTTLPPSARAPRKAT